MERFTRSLFPTIHNWSSTDHCVCPFSRLNPLLPVMTFHLMIVVARRQTILTCNVGVINIETSSAVGCLYSRCCCRMCKGTASSAACVKREIKSRYCVKGLQFSDSSKNYAHPYLPTHTATCNLKALTMSLGSRFKENFPEIREFREMVWKDASRLLFPLYHMFLGD